MQPQPPEVPVSAWRRSRTAPIRQARNAGRYRASGRTPQGWNRQPRHRHSTVRCRPPASCSCAPPGRAPAAAAGCIQAGPGYTETSRSARRGRDCTDEVFGRRKVAGEQPFRLQPQKRPPRGVVASWCRTVSARTQDRSHGRFTDLQAEADQFAVHPPISPPRVLAGQTEDQVPDLFVCSETARAAGVGPRAFDQTAMPSQ